MTRPKTGGRQKGTKNRITDAHRAAIHRACREIGSGRALVGGSKSDPLTRFYVKAWHDQPAVFLSKVLPAVLPPPPRPPVEPVEEEPPLLDAGALSDFEAARRVAFVLRRGLMPGTGGSPPVEPVEPSTPALPAAKEPIEPAAIEIIPVNFRDLELVRPSAEKTLTGGDTLGLYPGSGREHETIPEEPAPVRNRRPFVGRPGGRR